MTLGEDAEFELENYRPDTKKARILAEVAQARALERIADALEAQGSEPEPVIVERVTVINPITKLEAMSSKEKFAYIRSIRDAKSYDEANNILTELASILEESR